MYASTVQEEESGGQCVHNACTIHTRPPQLIPIYEYIIYIYIYCILYNGSRFVDSWSLLGDAIETVPQPFSASPRPFPQGSSAGARAPRGCGECRCRSRRSQRSGRSSGRPGPSNSAFFPWFPRWDVVGPDPRKPNESRPRPLQTMWKEVLRVSADPQN